MRRAAILVSLFLVTGPAFALPGPLRLAEAQLPVRTPTRLTAVEYVTNSAMADLFEIEAAKLALQKSKSIELRKFANLMITAHAEMNRQLKATLPSAAVQVSLPTSLDASHVVLLTQLRNSSGQEFDTRYIQQQVDGHQSTLEMHQSYAKRGEDPALKRLAADMENMVALHLAQAQKISYSLGGLQPRA